jgi:hypothetical protein
MELAIIMGSAHSLDVIVQMYKRCNATRLQAQLASYKHLILAEAILHAGMAEYFSEKSSRWVRHDHQRRLKRASLKAAVERLRSAHLSNCASFHELFLVVQDSIASIPGIGELMVYDTSLRIGAHLGLEADRVYLHSGTKEGARRLGMGVGAPWIDQNRLPEPLQSLLPREVEDLLCIYKDHLTRKGD